MICQLLTNRAHVHLLIGNYGHAIQDCLDCLKMQPDNVKAMYRIAKAANHIFKHDLALQYVEKALQIEPQNKQLATEKQIALDAIALAKKKLEEKKKPTQAEQVKELIEKKKIKVSRCVSLYLKLDWQIGICI